jgi:tRNA A-37 threonylcarbamoyl transferase component Bud32
MKPQDRVKLINDIAYRLQEDMQLTDIKSYFFPFGINCNFIPSSNSKRVFVQEALSNVENKVILNVGKDLKLVSNANRNLEVVLNNIYKKCIIEDEDFENLQSYLPFYEDILPQKLAHIFSYFHFSLNSLFGFLNQKIGINGHYNADQSRELIWLIDNINTLLKALESINTKYFIHKSYLEVIGLCEKFLVSSGGSPIPENFNAINIIEIEPIFTASSIVKVNKYEYETKHIGSGSYAEVFKYKDTFYNKHFVIKKAKSNLVEKEVERFKREFETMKTLNSPYILEAYNFNEEDNSYVMEFADFTIGKYIEKNNTKLQKSQRINIVNQIFKAFEYLHSKEMLHRDISMSNILLKQYENDLLVVKLADFGLVKLKDSQLTSEDTEFKGSLNDPNLEVKGGFKNFSIEHETYALTRLVHFIMTGRKTIDKKFDNNDFQEFVLNGISNDLENRYKNIREMRNKFNLIKFKK